MALKKSQLYSSLWQSCDELRGGMDASQYKDYVLTLLFMKYVSDRYAGQPDALIVVPDGGGFADMVKLKGDKEIGDKINTIIGRLAEANDLKGVIDEADFNDESKLGAGKEMQDRLSKLVAIFESLDLSANRAEGDDLLGDAYEYLMRHFATESGKSKGQFYTPAEVSRVMAKVIGIGPDTRPDQTIYDPTCGSGSLLLKVADEAPRGITIYGQEMDNATWALARMNMFLHGHPTAELWRGNTLADPYFKSGNGGLKTFDFAVANPPFSAKAWSNGLDPDHDEFRRFEYGIPPAKNGDYAFLLHLVTSLNSKGKGAIILPHGVLFRSNREADIRRNLVRRRLIKGIIGLPANLFYGTSIAACILVIDKENAAGRTGIFMIDASKGFLKDGSKNRLRAQDILDSSHTNSVHVVPGEMQNLVEQGDLLFNGTSETPGDVAMSAVMGQRMDNLYLNSFCFGFRIHDKTKYCPEFLAYFFRSSRGRTIVSFLVQGATRHNISKRQFLRLKLPIPIYGEQCDIVDVLREIDAEIDSLIRCRNKIQAIRQGVMKQIIAGRMRLIAPEKIGKHEVVRAPATRQHNWQFNEAVVISTLVRNFGTERYPLGRMRYSKLMYLLHRHKEGQAKGYLKKAAGPYNPRARYGGPEGIAVEKKYVRRHKNGKYQGFVADSHAGEAEQYFHKWYRTEALQWLEQFRYKKNDELELLTTVDMAAEELRAAGKEVSVENVKDVILGHREWKAKMDRRIFADANVSRAIEDGRTLFAVGRERDTA